MNKSKILIGLILLLYALFIIFQLIGYGTIADNIRCFIFPTVAVVYFLTVKKKSTFFTLFLVFYSVSDILYLFSDFIGYRTDYFIGNYLYITAYTMLLIKICKSISLVHVLKNLKIHLLVLLLLNIYIVYVLQVIIDQRIAQQGHEYLVEMLYNIVILLLLTTSLLNYFYRDNKKSLYLFVGSLCIVFSEVISVAYLYVAKKELLDFFALSLALLAFYFFYQQSKLENSEELNNVLTH